MSKPTEPRSTTPIRPLHPREELSELVQAVYGAPQNLAAPDFLTPAELDRVFSRRATREDGDGLPPEHLAAFLDGTLEADEREEVVDALASDEAAYRQFVAAARFRIQRRNGRQQQPALGTEAEEDRAPVTTRKARRLLVPVAAAALLAAGVWSFLGPGPMAPLSGELLAAMASPDLAEVSGYELGGTRLGGPSTPPSPTARAALFELGVRTFDLAQAVHAGDRHEAQRRSEEIPKLLEIGLFAAPHEAAPYEEIARRLAADEEIATVAGPIAEAERALLAELDWPTVHFGRWLESVRFAAAARDAAWFRSSAGYLRPLSRFRREEPSEIVSERLDALPASPTGALDFQTIQADVEAVLLHCMSGQPCLEVD